VKKLTKYLDSSEAHFYENHAETQSALKEAKQVLLDAEGTREEREELLEALLTFRWVEGGHDHQS
jgi:hypothetical protein